MPLWGRALVCRSKTGTETFAARKWLRGTTSRKNACDTNIAASIQSDYICIHTAHCCIYECHICRVNFPISEHNSPRPGLRRHSERWQSTLTRWATTTWCDDFCVCVLCCGIFTCCGPAREWCNGGSAQGAQYAMIYVREPLVCRPSKSTARPDDSRFNSRDGGMM